MNKTEFLLALQKQIGLLEDDEQKDIIDEYSQHIDMKIESGMSEKEAIEDFGPLDQLVSDILSAYHVKAPAKSTSATSAPMPTPDPNANGSNTSSTAKALEAEKVIESGKQVAASAVEATKKGATKLKKAMSGAAAKTKDAASKAGEKTKSSSAGFFTKAKQGAGNMASGIAKGGGALGSGIVGFTLTCIRWCWNIFIACVCAFFLLCAFVCLFSLGFSIVLALQGYPLVGVSLCSLGLLLASLSLALLTAKLIRRKAATPSRNAADSLATTPLESTAKMPKVSPLASSDTPTEPFSRII